MSAKKITVSDTDVTMVETIFLGGVRVCHIMSSFYVKYIELGNVVHCPNLITLNRSSDLPLSSIMGDCLRRIDQCDRAVFIVFDETDLQSDCILMEIHHCVIKKIPYEVIYVESSLNEINKKLNE